MPGGVLHGRNAAQLANGVPCDTSWPTFQCNNNRTGASANTITLPLGVKWEFTGKTGLYSNPVVANGIVFFGGGDRQNVVVCGFCF